jgi:hypothetical protein
MLHSTSCLDLRRLCLNRANKTSTVSVILQLIATGYAIIEVTELVKAEASVSMISAMHRGMWAG